MLKRDLVQFVKYVQNREMISLCRSQKTCGSKRFYAIQKGEGDEIVQRFLKDRRK